MIEISEGIWVSITNIREIYLTEFYPVIDDRYRGITITYHDETKRYVQQPNRKEVNELIEAVK